MQCKDDDKVKAMGDQFMRYLIAISLVILLSGCSEDKVFNIDEVHKVGGIVCNKNNDKPVTGIVNSYFDNGKLKAEIPFKNGKSDGIEKAYYESGNLRFETPYKNGKKSGISNAYYESGQLWVKTPYEEDKENGVVKMFYESGKLGLELPYIEGEKNGIEYSYEESGHLSTEVDYKNGIALSGYTYSAAGRKRKLTGFDLLQVNHPKQ